MKFAYYRNLTARQRRIYDRSDAVASIRIPAPQDLAPLVAAIAAGLQQDDRARTQDAAGTLVQSLLHHLQVPGVRLRVLAVRPANRREELHGLYEFDGGRQAPLVTVWMRTAQRRQVVAFRTFLRTLLHEVVHHLDYQLLRLEDSYHTQGFYKRAESLYRQLVPQGAENAGAGAGQEQLAGATATARRRRTPGKSARPGFRLPRPDRWCQPGSGRRAGPLPG